MGSNDQIPECARRTPPGWEQPQPHLHLCFWQFGSSSHRQRADRLVPLNRRKSPIVTIVPIVEADLDGFAMIRMILGKVAVPSKRGAVVPANNRIVRQGFYLEELT